ncbi:hypothetical protein BIU95_00190 [Curtobacterium sp. MCBA15_007]|nr:hypothetical protein H489_0102860 [Curtobacterium flaccumfaciens UCD-AKU]OII09545.1 hypothetical protein BIU95_00190 [Curtobacterium sp. MCBA15_007]
MSERLRRLVVDERNDLFAASCSCPGVCDDHPFALVFRSSLTLFPGHAGESGDVPVEVRIDA